MPEPDDFSRAPERPLFALLDRLGVAHTTVAHLPTRTVADSREVKAALTGDAGGHTKNLFMKDKAGRLVLVTAWAESALPLNQLHKRLGCQRLSFADAGLLWEALAVTPGSVTAFALMHDQAGRVACVLDAALLAFDAIHLHPLRNDMTTTIARDDLLAFLAAVGHEPVRVDFAALGPATA
jgi:Ala-tRNA(Pro) deacylase